MTVCEAVCAWGISHSCDGINIKVWLLHLFVFTPIPKCWSHQISRSVIFLQLKAFASFASLTSAAVPVCYTHSGTK